MAQESPSVLFGLGNLEGTVGLRAILRRRGVRVSASSRSRDLLDQAERHPPDVAVLGDSLDDLGCDVLIRLLRHRNPAVRIILLHSGKELEDPETCRPLGPFCCLAGPVSEEALGEAVTRALESPGSTRAAPRPPVIMCVDDDRRFLDGLARVLRRHGYAVASYDNPEKAREAVPIVNPTMVILDVLMPGMSGLDLASELREEHGDSLPLVLLSARGSDADITDGYRSGATCYMTKPCDPEALIDLAKSLVGPGPERPVLPR